MEIVWDLPLRAEGVEVQLDDGTTVRIRPLQPDDDEVLLEAFAAMSERSRYLRFHQARRELSGGLLKMLLDVDHDRQRAWVVIEPESERAIAFARLVRVADDSDVADAALSVIDEWQGRGFGRLLFDLLIGTARQAEIAKLRFEVLTENRPMLTLLNRLGAEPNLALSDPRNRTYDLPVGDGVGDDEATTVGALYEILRFIASNQLDEDGQ